MNDIKLTVLVENTARGAGTLAEHGLSFWIETRDQNILFDTGQTSVVLHNAAQLDVDLATADRIVLSHGHYDHTGGLTTVLPRTGTVPVHAHVDALTEKYAENDDGSSRPVGMPPKCRDMLAATAGNVPIEAPTEIPGGLYLTGPIPRNTPFETTGGSFFADPAGRLQDDLQDDQAAVVDTRDGLVVILGCAHAGVINTLRYVAHLMPDRPIHTVIGGMHLGKATAERIRRTVASFRELEVENFYPLHCTGFHATARLWNEFPGRVATCPVGTQLSWRG